jgi:basic amino acid/polyamine antiporter, APA family
VIHESFARLTSHGQTPAVAAVLMLAAAAILVPLGNIKTLAEASSFSALLAFLAVNATLIILRYRAPDHHRPFRVPFSAGRMPLLPILAIALIGLLLGLFERGIYIAGAFAMLGAAAIYGFQRLLERSRPR